MPVGLQEAAPCPSPGAHLLAQLVSALDPLTVEDHGPSGAAQGLVGCGGHHVGVLKGRRHHPSCHQAADVGHVSQEHCALLVADLPSPGEGVAAAQGEESSFQLGTTGMSVLLCTSTRDLSPPSSINQGPQAAGVSPEPENFCIQRRATPPSPASGLPAAYLAHARVVIVAGVGTGSSHNKLGPEKLCRLLELLTRRRGSTEATLQAWSLWQLHDPQQWAGKREVST